MPCHLSVSAVSGQCGLGFLLPFTDNWSGRNSDGMSSNFMMWEWVHSLLLCLWGIGSAVTAVYKEVTYLLSMKKEQPYSVVMS